MQKVIRPVSLLAVLGLFLLATVFMVKHAAAAGETIVGGTAFSGLKNTQIPINTVQINGSGNPTVPVRLFVSHGSLSFTTTTGLTFSGPSSGAKVEFSGTLTNVNAALASLRYTRTSIGTDTLEVSLVDAGEVFFADNGHLYEYVAVPGNINWNSAKPAAEARQKYGANGYLTTITSLAENDFVAARLLGAGWMGASDSSVEGEWRWVTGPENGTQFWSGNGSGSIFSGRYANWNNSSLPNGGTGNEPNDSGNEDCGQFLAGSTGLWNDLNCSTSNIGGYVVEYGAPGNMPAVANRNVTITTTAIPNSPANLGATAVVNGSWGSTATPTLAFTMTDEDTSDELRYHIQVDDTANFSSPVVDYQSGPKSQGSFNFVVGQVAGAGTSGVGTYTTGNAGQTLADGQYYWRVKAIDDSANESSYTTARSGQVAFGVDTTGPIITITGDQVVKVVQGETYTDAGATASDAVDGNVTGNIQVTTDVDTDVLGEYSISYNVTDQRGNAAEQAIRTVIVVSDIDRNNDGIADGLQDNISGYQSSITGKTVVIDAGQNCELISDDIARESSLEVSDPGFDYQNGLFEFGGDCGTPGFSTTIKIYYYGVTKDGLVARKYNPNTKTYGPIPASTISQTSIDGSPVTILSYNVTDGGFLDTDQQVNGEFMDPAGLASAIPSTSLADTGQAQNILLTYAFVAITSGLALLYKPLKSRINN